jgi:hypothetical protein
VADTDGCAGIGCGGAILIGLAGTILYLLASACGGGGVGGGSSACSDYADLLDASQRAGMVLDNAEMLDRLYNECHGGG